MECFGTTDFDNNSRLVTLSAIIISGLHRVRGHCMKCSGHGDLALGMWTSLYFCCTLQIKPQWPTSRICAVHFFVRMQISGYVINSGDCLSGYYWHRSVKLKIVLLRSKDPLLVLNEKEKGNSITSFLCHKVVENCALPGYCAANSGNFLPTFWDNLSFPWTLIMGPDRLSRNVGTKLPLLAA
jgi:hypothetical protein